MKIAICEDDKVFAQELATHIQTFFTNKKIKTCITFYSDEQVLKKVCEDSSIFDIIFMDIHLGGQSDGIDISKKIRVYAPQIPIIFLTGMENRAIDGYDVNAFSFLVKKKYTEKISHVLEKLWKQMYETETLTVTEKNEIHVLSVKDILWIESDGRSSLVHTMNLTYTDTRSIQNMAADLNNANFIECFKSIYVNIEKIRSVNSNTITLINDHKLPVSRRSRKSVMMAVMEKVRKQ